MHLHFVRLLTMRYSKAYIQADPIPIVHSQGEQWHSVLVQFVGFLLHDVFGDTANGFCHLGFEL